MPRSARLLGLTGNRTNKQKNFMTIKTASKQLEQLGFTMNSKYGTAKPESFTSPYHILSIPSRNVYIGKAKGGYYITSHINFKARLYRACKYNTFAANVNNIFGHGKTLALAVYNFRENFLNKNYNV